MSLVTIGLPTYRRPESLRRAALSALAQDHRDLEVVVSDNGSGDATADVCRELAAADPRLRYLQQPVNKGPAANFQAVLDAAEGKYFMWLGDDDWIDPAYVSGCLRILASSPEIAIVGGIAKNYRAGKLSNETRQPDLVHDNPSRRLADFYRTLGNNAIFYGLMRRATIASCVSTNTLGGDWLLMAQVAFQGKMLTNPEVSIHREREGGTSQNIAHMVKTLGLPRVQAYLPTSSVAVAAARDILRIDAVFGRLGANERRLLASAVGAIILARLGILIRLTTLGVSVLGRDRALRWSASVGRAARSLRAIREEPRHPPAPPRRS
jgi:glycosyltransferase involved in cell wall biosynthesis